MCALLSSKVWIPWGRRVGGMFVPVTAQWGRGEREHTCMALAPPGKPRALILPL